MVRACCQNGRRKNASKTLTDKPKEGDTSEGLDIDERKYKNGTQINTVGVIVRNCIISV
jgi:hypothetical protein